jgi:hypothetical protein
MVKMGLPPGAAKNAMVKDGIAESETYLMDLDPKKSHASQVSFSGERSSIPGRGFDDDL